MKILSEAIFLLSGFNSTETKIQTPDGKVWKEQEFHDLSRDIYRDLSRQFAGNYTMIYFLKKEMSVIDL